MTRYRSIYIIKNKLNNKQYVGQTLFLVEDRWTAHIQGTQIHSSAIQQAIQKYGVENFIFQEIFSCSDEQELNAKEVYFINFFNTFGKQGYNKTSGGDSSSMKFSDEVRKKMSNAKLGKPSNNKTRSIVAISSSHSFYFQSIKDASIELNVPRANVNRSIKTGIKANGYNFLDANQNGSTETKKSVHVQRLDGEPTIMVEYNPSTSSRQPSKYEIQKEEIIRLYNETNSSYKVAAQLNLDKSHIMRYLKKWGVARTQSQAYTIRNKNRYKLDSSFIQQVQSLFKDGINKSKISKILNVNEKTVYRALEAEDIV